MKIKREQIEQTLLDFLSDYRNGYDTSKEQGLNLEYCTFDTIIGFIDYIESILRETEADAKIEQTKFLQGAEKKFGKVDWEASMYELRPRDKKG